ncbi:MAG: nucleoside-diphosphate sugar epimerase/dehydratase [Desulfobulbus sp.]|jgi:FlaA1/EpsC-like NDP-sugar epimerase|nr:nucleoside-diphosphate sugar epimerase/dehydratase [Desulfobulbus sp.]
MISDSILAQGRLFRNLVKNPKFWFVLCVDIILVILVHYLAYAIRFESHLYGARLEQFFELLPLILLVKIALFYIFGLYRGMWRYTSLYDIVTILIVSLVASCAIVSLLLFSNRFIGFSRSVFLLDFFFTFGFISIHRMVIRYLYQKTSSMRSSVFGAEEAAKKRLLLIGTGDAAEKILREMQENTAVSYKAVGIVDDNPAKIGLRLHGIPVVGLTDDLKEHARRVLAQEALITSVNVNGAEMRRIAALCRSAQLPFKVMPGLGELISGKVSIKNIRDVSYKDLLGREEVRLDQDKIGGYISGQTILITGAGGSIGSELCRQVLRFSPRMIILFDSSEENLYNVQMELRHEHEQVTTATVLGKVQDVRILDSIFSRYRPSVVFHTAAYKHVPLVEQNPWQAVDNNIAGTQLLIEAAISNGVERFVLVSTDKAVRPTNVMGASKRVTELLMLAYGSSVWDGCASPPWTKDWRTSDPSESSPKPPRVQHQTRFMGVRFGNVLGSSGSVIPLFKRQIEKGGPVTVTHPDVTRYFMSAEEAAQLILQAGSMGNGGEIFILKMGEPVKIAHMAHELIKLTGREPESEIEIRYIGLRPGEKLYEELITEGEGIVDTAHEKIMVLRGGTVIPCSELHNRLQPLADYARNLDSHGIKRTLQEIVPEYVPDYSA